MAVLELDRIEIDHCLACGGVWLDAGELEALLEDPAQADHLLEVAAAPPRYSRKRCPICGRRLELIPAPDGTFPMDRCPRGCGWWFDRGELPEVIHLLEGGRAGRVARFLQSVFNP